MANSSSLCFLKPTESTQLTGGLDRPYNLERRNGRPVLCSN
jgi:hypothetical protein